MVNLNCASDRVSSIITSSNIQFTHLIDYVCLRMIFSILPRCLNNSYIRKSICSISILYFKFMISLSSLAIMVWVWGFPGVKFLSILSVWSLATYFLSNDFLSSSKCDVHSSKSDSRIMCEVFAESCEGCSLTSIYIGFLKSILPLLIFSFYII